MQNQTLETLLDHRSYRDYTDQPVSHADLEAIVACAHRAPSSVNGQHVSMVVVRDQNCRAAIAELSGGQPWIAQAPVFLCVVIDFAKTDTAARHAGIKQVLHESLEGFAVGCVDAGIALASAMTAARSLGLGTVPIGGIRANPAKLIELLGLPHLTFPIVGCSIGHFASRPQQKPRLPIHSFRHDETWHGVLNAAIIDSYDAELAGYWREIGRPDGQIWSKGTASRYAKVYHPDTKPVAASQGFVVDK